jgi:sugar lactone lactonase YvrE
MKTYNAQRLDTPPAKLAEGCNWDAVRASMIGVDITGGTFNRYFPASKQNMRYPLGQMVGAAMPYKDGRAIICCTTGVFLFDDRDPGDPHVSAALARPPTMSFRERFNDAKLDPAGRLVAGTCTIGGNLDGIGHLYSLELDGVEAAAKCTKQTELLSGLYCSNGLAWSADTKTLYFIDSHDSCIFAFDYDILSGGITKRRRVAELGEGVIPDGMTIDKAGLLWVAIYNGGHVLRIDPKNGDVVAEVVVPQLHTTCANFGESDNLLYITTADDTNQDFVDTAPNGGLYVAKVEI